MCEDSAFREGHGAEHASAKHFAGVSVHNTRDLSMASAHASQIKAGTSFCPGSSRRNRAMERFVASFVRKDRSHEFFSCEFFSCQTLVLTLLNTKLASPRSTTLGDVCQQYWNVNARA